jgi:non-specific serine/threonine protein kinase
VLWERTGKRFGGNAVMEGLHQRAETGARDGLGGKRYERQFRDGAARELSDIVDLATRDADRLPPASRGQLTRREQEVAALVGESLTNSQIARRLVISSRTVDAHIASIYAKLGISSRVQLVTWLSAQA